MFTKSQLEEWRGYWDLSTSGKCCWVDHLISRGRIVVSRDEASGLYLFPDGSETLEAFRQLRDGHITALRY